MGSSARQQYRNVTVSTDPENRTILNLTLTNFCLMEQLKVHFKCVKQPIQFMVKKESTGSYGLPC